MEAHPAPEEIMNPPNPVEVGPHKFLDWVTAQVANNTDLKQLAEVRALVWHELAMTSEFIYSDDHGQIADDDDEFLGALQVRLRGRRLVQAIEDRLPKDTDFPF
jgi:hypothetical protein